MGVATLMWYDVTSSDRSCSAKISALWQRLVGAVAECDERLGSGIRVGVSKVCLASLRGFAAAND